MSNSEIAVRVEGLGKRYLLPHQGQRKGLDLARSHLAEFLPFLAHEEQDYFWALKDVSFELKRGDIVGILGRNGSGKSTLLKILSGITLPTTGRAELHGRIGSLLEVGTGFHPDLSGRENVFMAGALLGLKQREIRARFDEIVDFAGIEKFIDLPVKRYSSGMYVRLAYAVASMLRSDILILDEVMAVGDAGFKEKSKNNIKNISGDGRTVIFVSHSMDSVLQICKSGMFLEGGQLVDQGSAGDIVNTYLRSVNNITGLEGQDLPTRKNLKEHTGWSDVPGWEGRKPWISEVFLSDAKGVEHSEFTVGDSISVNIECNLPSTIKAVFEVQVFNLNGQRVMTLHSLHSKLEPFDAQGRFTVECAITDVPLVPGEYTVGLLCGDYATGNTVWIDMIPNAIRFRIHSGSYPHGPQKLSSGQGFVVQRSEWNYVKAAE